MSESWLAAWGMVVMRFGEALILSAHLLAMNLATAGPFLALWLMIRARRRNDPSSARLARSMLGASLSGGVVGVALGLILLAWVVATQANSFWSAVQVIPFSRFTYGTAELVFFFACCGGAWLWGRRGILNLSRRAAWMLGGLIVLGGTNLAYHFPPLFAMLGALTTRPETWGSSMPFTAALVDPEIAALSIHFLLASFAVAGVVLSLLASRSPQQDDAWAKVAGGRWVVGATALQALSGLALLAAVPDRLRDTLLGGSPLATGWFLAGLAASVWLFQRSVAVALGDDDPRDVRRMAQALVATVVLMSAALGAMRAPWRPAGAVPAACSTIESRCG